MVRPAAGPSVRFPRLLDAALPLGVLSGAAAHAARQEVGVQLLLRLTGPATGAARSGERLAPAADGHGVECLGESDLGKLRRKR